MSAPITRLIIAAALLIAPVAARAQLEIVTNDLPAAVISGGRRTVPVTLRNPAAQPLQINLRLQLNQASSATALRLGSPTNWKTLQIAPGQTVLDSFTLDFPSVRAETRFIVQCVNDASQVLAATDVLAYPTNILQPLKTLAGEKPLGVFDPANQLKPQLKALGIEFEDLAETGVARFTGVLAIIGPGRPADALPENLPGLIAARAKSGVAIVWLRPPPQDQLTPSFFLAREGEGVVVVAQPDLVAHLADNPRAQLNLLELARLARHPETFPLTVNP